jgi:hypothetical protein
MDRVMDRSTMYLLAGFAAMLTGLSLYLMHLWK